MLLRLRPQNSTPSVKPGRVTQSTTEEVFQSELHVELLKLGYGGGICMSKRSSFRHRSFRTGRGGNLTSEKLKRVKRTWKGVESDDGNRNHDPERRDTETRRRANKNPNDVHAAAVQVTQVTFREDEGHRRSVNMLIYGCAAGTGHGEQGRKMLLFRLLLLLSLTFCQAAAKANSTQVYYTKMTIDRNALDLIINELKAFECNDGNKLITQVHMTT
ncbi:hypothetical protein FQA47_000227, partial [Oryzias melastigma]